MATNTSVKTPVNNPPPLELDLDIDALAPDQPAVSSVSTGSTSPIEPLVTDIVILLDPGLVRVPDTPNRTESAFEDEKFEELRASILARGENLQPIRVRQIVSSDGRPPHYELIWGERRLRACRDAGLPVRAIVAKAETLADDFLDRIRENRGRADLSPYEFCLQVRHVLDKPPGMKKIDLAAKIGASVSTISRAYDMACLPEAVVRAFESPNDLRYEDVKPLRDAFVRNAAAVEDECGRVKGESEPVPAPEIVKRLVQASKGLFASCKQSAEVGQATALESHGKPVGFWRVSPKGAVEVHIEAAMSDSQRDALMAHLTTFLERKVLQRPKTTVKPLVSEASKSAEVEATSPTTASADDTSTSSKNDSDHETVSTLPHPNSKPLAGSVMSPQNAESTLRSKTGGRQ